MPNREGKRLCKMIFMRFITSPYPSALGATVCTHLRKIQLLFFLYFSFFFFSIDEKKQKSSALRGAFFRTFLCTNSLISRAVLRRPFPFRTFRRFRKPDNAPSSYTDPLISEFLPRHFARHRLRIKGSAYSNALLQIA